MQLGMPNPKETPKRTDRSRIIGMYVKSTTIAMNDKITPESIQKRINFDRATLLANKAPIKVEKAIPAK
jgi:hypothetical protein